MVLRTCSKIAVLCLITVSARAGGFGWWAGVQGGGWVDPNAAYLEYHYDGSLIGGEPADISGNNRTGTFESTGASDGTHFDPMKFTLPAVGVFTNLAYTLALWAEVPSSGAPYLFTFASSTGSIVDEHVMFWDADPDQKGRWYNNTVLVANLVETTQPFTPGEKVHWVFVTEANNFQIYTNGYLWREDTIGAWGGLDSEAALRMGGTRVSSTYVNAADDIRIYSKALNATDALGIFQNSTEEIP